MHCRLIGFKREKTVILIIHVLVFGNKNSAAIVKVDRTILSYMIYPASFTTDKLNSILSYLIPSIYKNRS